jgi:putative transposase
MDYDKLQHSKSLILYHIILVTKYRHKILNILNVKQIFRDIENKSKFVILEMEVDVDHIHFLIQSIPTLSISQIIRRLKQESTIRIWQKYSDILSNYFWRNRILWSRGYFACTIGNVSKEMIIKYIQLQG